MHFMQLSIIVAMDQHRLIGRDNQLPWHLPADLAHFKKITLGKPIVMGRKTFESMGRALPGRRNVVLTRQTQWQATNCEVVHSLAQVMTLLKDESEAMIIGGADLFAEALPHVSHLYITWIDAVYEGDTYFPMWKQDEWKQVSEHIRLADEKNEQDMCFVELIRHSFF